MITGGKKVPPYIITLPNPCFATRNPSAKKSDKLSDTLKKEVAIQIEVKNCASDVIVLLCKIEDNVETNVLFVLDAPSICNNPGLPFNGITPMMTMFQAI